MASSTQGGVGAVVVSVAVLLLAGIACCYEEDGTSESFLHMTTDLEHENLLLEQFAAWAHKHGKAYHDAEQCLHRFAVWKDNLAYIRHSETNRTYSLGLTKFADLTNEEFRRVYTGTRIDRSRRAKRRTGFRYADSEAPESVDWRKNGAVTSVKDQGSCGKMYFWCVSVVFGCCDWR